MLLQRSPPAYQLALFGSISSSNSRWIVRNAVPRGASCHLYPPLTVYAKRLASIGSQPTACVVSSMILVPVAAHAATSASRSAIRPLADCTADTDTSVVVLVTASAMC